MIDPQNSLEENQNTDNALKTALHSTSPSLDMRQARHDANEMLLRGAKIKAAAQTLGLTEDEMFIAVMRNVRAGRNYNRQQQAKGKQPIDLNFDKLLSDTIRDRQEVLFEQQTARGTGYGSDEAFAYGQAGQDALNETYGAYNDDRNIDDLGPERFSPEAPSQAVMRDAIRRLEGSTSPMAGIAKERLNRDLKGTDAVTAEDVKLLATKEATRFDPLRAGYNEVKAGIEAEGIARDQRLSTNDMLAREAFARIGRGGAILGDAAVTPQGVYVDPRTGTPIVPEKPVVDDVFAGGNTPDTAQQLNAPRQTVQQWVFNHQPVDRQQVSINAQLNQLSDFFRGIGPATAARLGDTQLRTLAEVESITDTALSELQAQGKVFYEDVIDPQTGAHRRGGVIANPGFGELLNYKKVGAFQQEQLGRALLSLGMAQERDTNPVAKEAYRRRGNPKASDLRVTTEYRPKGEEIQLASLGRERVPTETKDGPEIRRAFKGLSGVQGGQATLSPQERKMARSPIIGATAEDPGRAKRSLSYNNTGESTPEGIRTELTRRAAERGQQPKEQNIVKAQIVQERADRDAQRRERRIADITTPSEPRSLGGDPVIPDRAEIDREQERLEKLRLSGQDVRVGRPHLRRF